MEIKRLIQFRTVFETENMRESANLLGMTPGALSKAIKVLEDEAGMALFVRKGRHIVPTEEARSFYQGSARVIDSYQTLMDRVTGQPEVVQKTLNLTSWEVFTSYFVGYLASEHFKEYSLKVLERAPQDLEKSILKGEADIGITYAPIPHKDLSIPKVTTIEYGIFSTPELIESTQASELPFAVPITQVSGSPTGVKTLDGWPEDIPRKVQFKFELLESALETTRRGISAIHCPRFIVGLQNSKKNKLVELKNFIPARKRVRRDVFLVYRKSTGENSKIKKIAKALRLVSNL